MHDSFLTAAIAVAALAPGVRAEEKPFDSNGENGVGSFFRGCRKWI